MSADSVMDAVLILVQVDNEIARAVKDIPNDLNIGQLPATVVTCPKTVERRFNHGYNQETHTVMVEYLDAPEANANQRQGIQAARAWLEQAKLNLRQNRQLSLFTSPQAFEVRDFITEAAEPFSDADSSRILIHGQFTVEIVDIPVPLDN